MKEQTIKMIEENRIIAIARDVAFEEILPVAKALYDGGIRLVEVTFDQAGEEDTAKAIKSLCSQFDGRMSIGAGTVLSVRQVEMAVEAGAEYILSPNTDLAVIQRSKELGVVSIPGALTPTEVQSAYAAGADFVKLFPAGVLGLDYIEALLAPLKHIPMLAVGGVDEKNLMGYLDAGVHGVGIGSGIIDKELIDQKKYDELTMLAKKYTEQLRK